MATLMIDVVGSALLRRKREAFLAEDIQRI